MGKVLRFDGTPAVGVAVQIGDATADDRVQVTTGADGSFVAMEIAPPYTISAVPPNTDIPVSFKNVTTANPQIVLEPRNGVARPCSREEAYIRFRLDNTNVQTGNVGYVYYVAEGIHEDELRSNAVQVLYPGARSGTLRVRFSNNTCPTSVRGSLIYLERSANGYQLAGVIPDVTVAPGQTAPASTEVPFRITVSNTGSEPLTGQITLPTGYMSGSAAPLLKAGKASVLLGDSRDWKKLTTGSESGNRYGFALPPALQGVSYRVAVFATGPQHISWLFSDALEAIPAGGKTIDITTPTTFQPQEPAGNIGGQVSPTFAWTAAYEAHLYSMNVNNLNCNPMTWMAVATGAQINDRTQFRLPRLPLPARMDIGTNNVPCRYRWFARSGVRLRVPEDAASDRLLDGRLVLKRHYSRPDAAFLLHAYLPVYVDGAPQKLLKDAVRYRDDLFADMMPPVQSPANTLNSTADAPPSVPVVSATIRNPLNLRFTTYNVGPWGNPDEVSEGVHSTLSQQLQTQQ